MRNRSTGFLITAFSGLLGAATIACDGFTEPFSVVVTPASATLNVGDTQQFTASVTDANGKTVTDREITWSSSDPSIASVSGTGLVTALSGGTTSIVAQVPEAGGSVAVTVIPLATGQWTGSSLGLTLSLTLTETSGQISGTATLASSSQTVALTVTGLHAHPSVSLTLSAAGFEPTNYTGTFSGNDAINGSLSGSGFVNFALNLTRTSSSPVVEQSAATMSSGGGDAELARALRLP
jgi:hypothetical protein